MERKKEMPVSVTALAPRVLRFIGSDESVDRAGDIVSVDGWNVKGYLSNPVVLFNHDYSKPVGKAQAVRINKRDKRLEFDVYFPTTEELSSDPKMPSEHALFIDTVYNMYKGGYLSAVSVGFKGEKAEPIPGSFGMKFLEQELLELSLVAVPANANALATAKSYGIHTELLGGVKMDTKEKSGARLSKTTREKLEGMHAEHIKLASNLRAFLDEDQGEQEEEGCNKGDGIEEPQPETGGIMKPKAADVPVSKVLILGVSAPEDTNLR
jgi:HK97 family phage prohead protease